MVKIPIIFLTLVTLISRRTLAAVSRDLEEESCLHLTSWIVDRHQSDGELPVLRKTEQVQNEPNLFTRISLCYSHGSTRIQIE